MSSAEPRWVELARRASNGTEIAVLWDRSTSRVKVAVQDDRTCHHVDLDVARPDALSAIHHVARAAASRQARSGPGRLHVVRPALRSVSA
jgi:hypothetical protein